MNRLLRPAHSETEYQLHENRC